MLGSPIIKNAMLFVAILLSTNSFSQNPVEWEYLIKKSKGDSFELHLVAKIKDGWHIYSQEQPADAISYPTTIKLVTNPLLILESNIKEIGQLERHKDETLGIVQNQYSGKVDFVLIGALKSKDSRTDLKGNITYQVCTDHECLKPVTIDFTVPIYRISN